MDADGEPQRDARGKLRKMFRKGDRVSLVASRWAVEDADERPCRRLLDVEGAADLLAAVDAGERCVVASPSAVALSALERCREFLEDLSPEEVVVIRDNDEPGRKGQEKTVAWYREHGFRVRAPLLPSDLGTGGDLRDYLNGNPERGLTPRTLTELNTLINAAPILEPEWGQSANEPTTDLRPAIQTTRRQLRETTAAALRVLHAANDPPRLFRRGARVVRVREDDDGRPFIEPVGVDAIIGHLTQIADFFGGNDGKTPVPPPERLAKTLLSSPQLDLPPLVGIAELPVLRPDRTILTEPGYDPATRLLYRPAPGVKRVVIPERVTPMQLRSAMKLIGELLVDFPFADETASRATALAAFFSVVLRPAIEGPVPLFAIDAPEKGTGKSLLAGIISILATGREGSKQTAPHENAAEEWRKRITAILSRGAPVAILDNIEDALRSESLAAVLTSDRWEDRLLGKTLQIELPARVIWLATGNNLRLGGDLARRAVWIRLDARRARPWQRMGFRHANITGWARKHHPELVTALLTVVRAWVEQGCPGPEEGTPPLGSYDSWREIVGGVLLVAGVPGFLGNLAQFYEEVDSEATQWTAFLSEWHRRFQDDPITVRMLHLQRRWSDVRDFLPEDLLADFDNDARFVRALGKALSKRVERRYVTEDGGSVRVLKAAQTGKKSAAWRVVREPGVPGR